MQRYVATHYAYLDTIQIALSLINQAATRSLLRQLDISVFRNEIFPFINTRENILASVFWLSNPVTEAFFSNFYRPVPRIQTLKYVLSVPHFIIVSVF
jgi:hypothetical protein